MPEEDRATWLLPLDEYLPPYFEAQYARQLLMRECMEGFGYTFRVAPVNVDAPPPATTNRSGRRLFDVSIAAVYGYHFAPSQREDLRLVQEIGASAYSDDEVRVLEGCQAQALEELQSPDDSLADWLGFVVDVRTDADVRAAAARWANCLEAVAPGRATEWPEDMPNRHDSVEFQLSTAVLWNAPPPSFEEVELALFDAECRESTGFAEAYYEAEWQAHLELIEQNLPALQAEAEFNEAYLQRARTVIAALADQPLQDQPLPRD